MDGIRIVLIHCSKNCAYLRLLLQTWILQKKRGIIRLLLQNVIKALSVAPVTINYNGTDEEALASTFEDCLVYTNFQLFKDMSIDDTGSLIKNVSDKIKKAGSFDEFHKGVYDVLRDGRSDQKAEFALDLIYAVDPSELTVPAYIAEGLEWLQSYLKPEE